MIAPRLRRASAAPGELIYREGEPAERRADLRTGSGHLGRVDAPAAPVGLLGRTIVLTTHAMQDIDICDEMIVLARYGRLAFAGSTGQATEHFQVAERDLGELAEQGGPRRGPHLRRLELPVGL